MANESEWVIISLSAEQRGAVDRSLDTAANLAAEELDQNTVDRARGLRDVVGDQVASRYLEGDTSKAPRGEFPVRLGKGDWQFIARGLEAESRTFREVADSDPHSQSDDDQFLALATEAENVVQLIARSIK